MGRNERQHMPASSLLAATIVLSLSLVATLVEGFSVQHGRKYMPTGGVVTVNDVPTGLTTSCERRRTTTGSNTALFDASAARGSMSSSSDGRNEDSSSSSDGTEQQRQQPQPPSTFREAEVMGLRLMQQNQYEDALKTFQSALKLPGSKTDVVRTQTIPGPSPVGGSAPGTSGGVVQGLDEFEVQAAHYNMACAWACLDNIPEAVASLGKSFNAGFDNYATVRVDPDLRKLHGSDLFEELMERVDPKRKGFLNPFGKLFGGR